MTDSPIPSEAFIVGDDGTPKGHIDLDRLQADATMLAYELAATAGDDAATDRVAEDWMAATGDADYFGYVAAGALSAVVRHILAPTLDVAANFGADLRPGLQESRDEVLRDLARPSFVTERTWEVDDNA